MTDQTEKSLLQVLCELAEGSREPTAALAEGLKRIAEGRIRDLDRPESRDIKERISALMEQFAAVAPAVMESLVEIDAALAARGVSDLPFATRLAPLALACALHSGQARWREELDLALASNAPIWSRDKKTLVAAPVGPLGEEGAQRFADRVFREVALRRPKRVVLVLGGLGEGGASWSVWNNLEKDLAAQGIAFEKRPDWP